MSKDEKTTSYIEEFNRSHRRIKREEKDWYVPYLPRGLGMEDITEKEDRELMSIFTQVEGEMERKFDLLVRDRFKGYFESLSMTDILEYLPQKPNLIILEDLKTEDRNNIKEIYETGIESGYIKKTIRKQIRKYLLDNAYLKKGEHIEYGDPEKSGKEPAAKGKTHDEKISIPDSGIDIYLPQKPIPLTIDMFDDIDRKAVLNIYREGIEAGYITKTIRKHIRKYLGGKDVKARIQAISTDQDTKEITSEGTPSGSEKSKKAKKTSGKGKPSTKKGVVKKSEKKAAKSPAGRSSDPEEQILKQIKEYLPTKPEVSMEDIETAHRKEVIHIYEKGMEAGFIKKTLRKQIRKYLDENNYLVPPKPVKEKKTKAPASKKIAGKEDPKTEKKKVQKKGKARVPEMKVVKPDEKKKAKKPGTGKGVKKKKAHEEKGAEIKETQKESKKRGKGKTQEKKEVKKEKGGRIKETKKESMIKEKKKVAKKTGTGKKAKKKGAEKETKKKGAKNKE